MKKIDYTTMKEGEKLDKKVISWCPECKRLGLMSYYGEEYFRAAGADYVRIPVLYRHEGMEIQKGYVVTTDSCLIDACWLKTKRLKNTTGGVSTLAALRKLI